MSRHKYGLIIIPVVLLVGACQTDTPVSPSASSQPAVRRELGRAPRALPGEIRFHTAAARIPSFGGYYTDSNGNLHVVLVELSDTQLAEDVLRPTFARIRRSAHNVSAASPRIVVHKGKFTFVQLAEWRDRLRLAGAQAGVLHSIDLDEARNQIVAGSATALSAARLREIGNALGLPADVLEVRIASRDFELTDSLTGYVTPHAGGLGITSYNANTSCTLGFNTLGGEFFVTNSHCTRVRGPEYSNVTFFYQPDSAMGTYVGIESTDPGYFSIDDDDNCPRQLNTCRYSDAALVEYSSFSAPGSSGQGILYKPSYAVSSGTGPRTISGTLSITGEVDYATQYQTLDKIGKATGWTYGTVVATCVDIESNWPYIYLCQDVVDLSVGSGDSGAPVFEYTSSIFDEVSLYGIARGYSATYGGMSFSPFGNISLELGYVPAT